MDVKRLCVQPDASIRQVISCIDRGGVGIALVVDQDLRLIGTITDGDVRRAMLAEIELDALALCILERKRESPAARPITARVGTPPEVMLDLMHERLISQLPIVDGAGRVVDLVTLNDLVPAQVPSLSALIMAGGTGTRLRPLTNDIPKPMLPVGGQPLMELIIGQLREAGIKRVNIATHYMPEKIITHFGDGAAFGVELKYVTEEQPLGTAGALGLMPSLSEPLLVINGDILTHVDFRAMLNYHKEYKAHLTVGVKKHEIKVQYGIIESEGPIVCGIREKPVLSYFVNAGIYLLEPSVYEFMPAGRVFNMTDIIQNLLNAGHRVVSFPIREYWLDIGQHEDYVQAQQDFKNGMLKE